MDQEKRFATVINCMDGRVQLPVINFIKEKFKVDYVDSVTEPGPNKILAENRETSLIESIKNRVSISVLKHGSKLIAVVGHYDCAGNPAEYELQIEHLKKSKETVDSWGFGCQIVLLWVDNEWKVHQLL